jgi:hypothetical protein
MIRDIDSVNHVGHVVRDLGAAAARFEEMGFVLSPLSMHFGSPGPGEPEQPLGSGNRCAIFPDNYLELVAHVDADKYDLFCGRYLERFEGAHIICFGCGDAGVVDERVREAGIDTSGVIPLQRDIDTVEGARTAKFDCVHFAAAVTPEGLIQAAHHRTPEFIHQARYLDHPNGAVALSDVYLSTADPAAAAERYEKLTGRAAMAADGRFQFEMPRPVGSRVTILAAADVSDWLPGAADHPDPHLAGYAFGTSDLEAVRRQLDNAEIAHLQQDGRVVVPAEAAFGAVVVFEPIGRGG